MADPFEEVQDHGKTLLSWSIPEFEKHERSLGWYVLATIATLGMLVWSLLSQNFLFAVIILLVAVILFRQQRQQPDRLNVLLTEDGIEISNHHFYSYKELRNFWIAYDPPRIKKLFIGFKAAFKPDLIIPLESQNPVGVRTILAKYLSEDLEREDEPLSEALGRSLKI